MKSPTRKQVIKSYSNYLIELLTGELEERLKEGIDYGYVQGYNTVLEAAEAALSPEDYRKIVKYLNKNGR